jgi:triacylglycerol esterase/lipase EstA (alpha/beta hydrolase family)
MDSIMAGPSTFLLSLEAPRGIYEFSISYLLNIPLQYISPKGDGHPVLIIPGLLGSDNATFYIRKFFNGLGYKTYPWGLGRNLGPREGMNRLLTNLVKRIEAIYKESDNKKITIIGQSLGGIYAREIAKRCPDLIRQVITLGTPFKNINDGTNISKLYEILSKDTSHKNPDIIKSLEIPPDVPFTSLFSKTDGIVSWKSSIEIESDISQNIEIPGASHIGLMYNPISLYVMATRLCQSENNWQHYKN